MQPIIAAKRFPQQTLALFASLKNDMGVYSIPSQIIQDLVRRKPAEAHHVMGLSPDKKEVVQPTLTNRVHAFFATLNPDAIVTILPSERVDEETGDDDLSYASYAADDDENDNCLAEFRCPECGEQSRFSIAVTTFATFDDTGSEVDGDNEFDNHSACTCKDCGHQALVRDFYTMHDE